MALNRHPLLALNIKKQVNPKIVVHQQFTNSITNKRREKEQNAAGKIKYSPRKGSWSMKNGWKLPNFQEIPLPLLIQQLPFIPLSIEVVWR